MLALSEWDMPALFTPRKVVSLFVIILYINCVSYLSCSCCPGSSGRSSFVPDLVVSFAPFTEGFCSLAICSLSRSAASSSNGIFTSRSCCSLSLRSLFALLPLPVCRLHRPVSSRMTIRCHRVCMKGVGPSLLVDQQGNGLLLSATLRYTILVL